MRARSLCLAAGLVAAASWSACKSTEQPKPDDDARVQTLEEQLQAAKQDAAAVRASLDETNARLERLAKERDEQAALLQQQEKERADRAREQDSRAREQARRLDALEHALAQRQQAAKPQGKPEQGKPEPALAVAQRSQDAHQPAGQPDDQMRDQLRQLREQLQRLREQLQQELREKEQKGAPRNCTPSRQNVDRHCTPTRTEMTRRETPPEPAKGKKMID